MSEFLLELYSEEIPPQLQINARNQLKQQLEESLEEEGIHHSGIVKDLIVLRQLMKMERITMLVY